MADNNNNKGNKMTDMAKEFGKQKAMEGAKKIGSKVLSKVVIPIMPYVGIFFLCLIAVGVVNLIMYLAKDAIFGAIEKFKEGLERAWNEAISLGKYDEDNATTVGDLIVAFNANGQYIINADNIQVLIEQLEEQKVDTDTLTNEPGKFEEIIKKYIKAEAATTCFNSIPFVEKKEEENEEEQSEEGKEKVRFTKDDLNGLKGKIKVMRDSKKRKGGYGEGTEYELTFLRYNEFFNDEYGEQDDDLYKHYTVDPNTFELLIPVPMKRVETWDNNGDTIKEEWFDADGNVYKIINYTKDEKGNKKEVNTEYPQGEYLSATKYAIKRIPYKTYIQDYATTFNFFMSMHLIVQDEKFMSELVDSVINHAGEIEILITDAAEATQVNYTYNEKVSVDYISYSKMTVDEFKENFPADTQNYDEYKNFLEGPNSSSCWNELTSEEKALLEDVDKSMESKEPEFENKDVKYLTHDDRKVGGTWTDDYDVVITVTEASTWWYEVSRDIYIDLHDKESEKIVNQKTEYVTKEGDQPIYSIYFVAGENIPEDWQISPAITEAIIVNGMEDSYVRTMKYTEREIYRDIWEGKSGYDISITDKNRKNNIDNFINLLKNYDGVVNKLTTSESSLEYQFQQYPDTQNWMEILKPVIEYFETEDEEALKESIDKLFKSSDQISFNNYKNQFGISGYSTIELSQYDEPLRMEGISLSTKQEYALKLMECLYENSTIDFVKIYKEGLKHYTENSFEHNRYIWDNWWSKMPNQDFEDGVTCNVSKIVICDKAFETYVKAKYIFSSTDLSEITYYTQQQLEACKEDHSKFKVTRTTENEKIIFAGPTKVTVNGIQLETYTSGKTGRTYTWYYQNEGDWADDWSTVNNCSFADGGCYCTTISIIASGYGNEELPNWGRNLTKIKGTRKLISGGNCDSKSQNLTENQLTEIKNWLKNGNEVIVHVYAPNSYTYGEFGQHWMPIVDINEDETQVYNMNTSSLYGDNQKGWVDINGVFNNVECYMLVNGIK